MGLLTDSLNLMYAQIRRDNPDVMLDATNSIVLGGPYTTELGTSGRNTRIILNGIAGTGTQGKRTVFYDRLALGKLYGGLAANIELGVDTTTLETILPLINTKYGIDLSLSELSTKSLSLDPTAKTGTFTIAVDSAKSLAFTGSLTVNWTRGKGAMYPNSGPGGIELLFGDLTAGYFGTVPAYEVLSQYSFFNSLYDDTAAGSNPAKLNNSSVGARSYYFKFVINNRFVFIPNVPDMYFGYFTEIYRLGMAYGLDEPKAQQSLQGITTETPQLKIMRQSEASKWWYHPRLLKMANDTLVSSGTTALAKANLSGDIESLLRRVFKVTSDTDSANWDNVNVATLLPTQLVWTSNLDSASNKAVMLSIGESSNAPALRLVDRTAVSNSTAEPNGLFVFELVRDGELMLPVALAGTALVNRLNPPRLKVEQVFPNGRLVPVGSIGWAPTVHKPTIAVKITDQLRPFTDYNWQVVAGNVTLAKPKLGAKYQHYMRLPQTVGWSSNSQSIVKPILKATYTA